MLSAILVAILAGALLFLSSAPSAPPPAPPAHPVGTAEPTLLPLATIAQVPLTAAYTALNIPSLTAGGSYADPTTQVKVYKLTSTTFPAAGYSWGHDYAEGGNEVSLPHTGPTRTIVVRQDPVNGGPWWLIDFTPGVGVGNARPLTGSLAPQSDLAFTFSSNPATPYYAYVASGETIRRFDLRTMNEVPGDGWPKTDSSPTWLHQSENDAFFVWMRGANGSTVVGYEPATATLKTYTNPNLNEPRIDRGGRYVGISMNTPQNGLVVWDWLLNTVTWTTDGTIPFAHNASLKRRWITVDWNMTYPPDFSMFIPDVPNSAQHIGGPANATLVHCSGDWVQSPANLNDQWALCTHYGSLRPPESFWLAPGGMVLLTPNGQRRLLGHPYNTVPASAYNFLSFPKLSPDGNYVLFTSDMNGSGRSDVFLVELPTDTVPPVVSLTAPADGAIVSGAAVPVAASASDNLGVAGVQFKLDGANLGAEVIAAPYALVWNTTTVLNGLHTLTAVARDGAGNTATSLGVNVTVFNADASPPLLSGITVSSISPNGAAIAWTTNEPSDSQVEYGVTSSYGSLSALNPVLVTAHLESLTGLAPGALYHYRVKSGDVAGNLAVSADFTFTTLVTAGVTISQTGADPASPSIFSTTVSPGAQSVVWSNLVNVVTSGSSVMKIAGCDGCADAGAVSQQQITAGDGYFAFTASETDTLRFIGFYSGNSSAGGNEMQFAVSLRPGGSAEVRERGILRTSTTYARGDVFRIAIMAGTVRYYKNGRLLYISALAPMYPLQVATSLLSRGATVTNAIISGRLSQ